MMKLLTCFLWILSFGKNAYAQDSSLVKQDNHIRGFYKSYQEFVQGRPSIIRDFTTEYFYHVNGVDSMVIYAKYSMPESLDNFGDFWGFSDGKDVFIGKYGKGEWKYWKAQCNGKNPFLYYDPPNRMLLFLLSPTLVAATSSNPNSHLFFISRDGHIEIADRRNLKMLFSNCSEVLKEFKSDKFADESTCIRYLRKYNQLKYNSDIYK